MALGRILKTCSWRQYP